MKPFIHFSASLLLAFAVLASTYPPLIYIARTQANPPEWIFSAITYGIIALISLLFIIGLSNFKPGKYGFRLPSTSYLFPAVFVGALIGLTGGIILALMKISETAPWPYTELWHVAAFPVAAAAISEELLCRGVVYGFLARYEDLKVRIIHVSFSFPVLASAFVFMVFQWIFVYEIPSRSIAVALLLLYLVLGIFASKLREESGSLFPPMFLHGSALAVGIGIQWIAGRFL